MTITPALVKPTKWNRAARASARSAASSFCLCWALLNLRRWPGGAGRSSRRCGRYAEILGSFRSSIGTSQWNACSAPSMTQASAAGTWAEIEKSVRLSVAHMQDEAGFVSAWSDGRCCRRHLEIRLKTAHDERSCRARRVAMAPSQAARISDAMTMPMMAPCPEAERAW